MSRAEFLIKDLPDALSARRFLDEFTEKHPSPAARMQKKEGLLSDVLTLVSYSPLLAATLLQNPGYVSWLDPKRAGSGVRDKETLSESLARFSLTNSQLEPQVLLSRFRRRELLRIFLRDIRRLASIAEITEEISNLADAVLDHALKLAARETENRHGAPLETDARGKSRPAGFCIFSLGKLGSKELNYSSDIDLLFVYSAEGSTSGRGTRGAVTNREYFVKLAELTNKLVGQQTGEGAAYRVDMRLRPHGRIGALALSLDDTARYYQTEARDWERQVLIRSRASAGVAGIYKDFFSRVEDTVFSKNETIENALRSVRLSKEKIDLEHLGDKGFNVKLGKGGVREIEFIAQALQLAYGGQDKWLRSPHTLISLSRLADRGLLSEAELTVLSNAYDFLRHLEHILQMEHGLQTHVIPADPEKRVLIAKRMAFPTPAEFEKALESSTRNVNRAFVRIFGKKGMSEPAPAEPPTRPEIPPQDDTFELSPDIPAAILASLSKSETPVEINAGTRLILERLTRISPHFAHMVEANPNLIETLHSPGSGGLPERDYTDLAAEVSGVHGFKQQISVLRRRWAAFLMELVVFDLFEKVPRNEVKRRQTLLAENAIETGLIITRNELEKLLSIDIADFPFAVMGLGKLGGGGMDYGSDLDLILVYEDEKPSPAPGLTHAEFYARAVEIFVNALSGMTRDGSLYRVDLRLRPYGKNGAPAISRTAFLDYLQNRAAIWEWLAYVKIRGVAGDKTLAAETQIEACRIIHDNAKNSEASDPGFDNLRAETRRVRLQLEKKRVRVAAREVDIKFGEGGMLDIYFLMRYLQLRDNVPDDEEDRSSAFMLQKLFENGSLDQDDRDDLSEGYEFLSDLDHNLRLTIGRSTRVPASNRNVLEIISARMKLASAAELLEKLTLHRLNIRAAFDKILS
jgi:glutamate-ammonia-ligase adenylyltransferase